MNLYHLAIHDRYDDFHKYINNNKISIFDVIEELVLLKVKYNYIECLFRLQIRKFNIKAMAKLAVQKCNLTTILYLMGHVDIISHVQLADMINNKDHQVMNHFVLKLNIPFSAKDIFKICSVDNIYLLSILLPKFDYNTMYEGYNLLYYAIIYHKCPDMIQLILDHGPSQIMYDNLYLPCYVLLYYNQSPELADQILIMLAKKEYNFHYTPDGGELTSFNTHKNYFYYAIIWPTTIPLMIYMNRSYQPSDDEIKLLAQNNKIIPLLQAYYINETPRYNVNIMFLRYCADGRLKQVKQLVKSKSLNI